MILSIAIPTTFSLVLLFLNGRIDLAQLKRTQFLVYQVGIPIAQCVGYFIILAIIGHLQPRWAGVLAVTFFGGGGSRISSPRTSADGDGHGVIPSASDPTFGDRSHTCGGSAR